MLHLLQLAQNSSKAMASLALALCSVGYWSASVHAEGSVDLTSSGGDRPFLEFRNDSSAGIPRKSIIKVYAKNGETINLGSSATGLDPDGAGGKPAATIKYRRPDNTSGSCTPGVGLIQNRNAEEAGPAHPTYNTNPNAFTPCIINVTFATEGVWEIEFESPDPSQTGGTVPQANPSPIAATASWTQETGSSWVAAWDVTVRDSAGKPITGRTFTNYLALNMGGNSRSLSSKVYIQTVDGYGYTIDMNGIDPFGFIFFANNKGFRDRSSNPIYRSLQFTGANPGSMPSAYSVQPPNSLDNPATRDYTHKIFFAVNGPDPTMPASANSPGSSTWLFTNPVPPPTPSNLVFTGLEGTPGKAGTNPLGGSFSFNATAPGAFTITLDLNQNGIYGDGNDRILIGTATTGSNTVSWDGKDGNGVPVPASNTVYTSRIKLYAGEVHFPFLDPENNPQGLIIQRIKDPGITAGEDPDKIYYNDRYNFTATTPAADYDFSLCGSGESPTPPGTAAIASPICNGTGPNPRSALSGVNSAGGAHRWSGEFGDRRGMDTWVFYPSAYTELVGGFAVREADLAITKTDNLTSVAAGSIITYTIVVTNNGPNDVQGASVKDTLPAILTNVTWTCTASTGSSCGVTSGSGNIDTTVNLKNGGTATYTVKATISPTATGTLQNTAIVLRPNDVNDPTDSNRTGAGNNSATDTTTLTSPIPNIRLVKRITALNNTPFTDVIDDPTDPNDDSSLNWNANYLQGRTGKNLTANDSVPVKPGDVLEYTIYFLSDGGLQASSINLCDLIPPNTTFEAKAFNGSTPRDGGSASADLGIRLSIDTSTVYLTNIADAPDRGEFLPAGVSTCGTNSNGAVIVRLSNLARAATKGTPNSYGFIRFRVKVN